MKWSRILMANGMRYDIPHDVTKSVMFTQSGEKFTRIMLEDGKALILNPTHIVSVEIDGGGE